MRKTCIVALALMLTALCLGGCGGDETVYDWQKPHDTYLVGTFSDGQQAEAMKTKLQRSGYECRIGTDIKNGEFVYTLLVDIYDASADSLSRLESVAGMRPTPLKSSQSGSVSKGI